MKIGVVFPQNEFGNDPAALRDFAQAAEALGYHDILIYDHVLGAEHAGREPRLTGPYTEATPFHEVFVLFGYWAAVTTRIELVTGVLVLPQRQTALVAKQAAEIDILSGGRLRLGVGTGWNWVEYDSLGEDFHNRGRRQEEQVEVLRRLWSDELLDYTGRWHRIERANILPRPARRIPVWFGGNDDRLLRRAARLGDGYFPLAPADERGQAVMDRLRGHLADAGRNPADFGIEAHVRLAAGMERCLADIEWWRGQGATHICMTAASAGLQGPQAHIDAIRRFKAEAPAE